MKRKILFLIGSYGTGGKERQLTELIRGIPKDKYYLYLFMKNNSSYYFSMIKSCLRSYRCLEKSHFSLLDILVLNNFLKEIDVDIVFSFSKTLSHYALILKLLGGFKYCLINGSIRDAPVDFNIYMRLEKLLYNLYGEVVANSKAGLLAYHQNEKVGRHVLYNGFDENRIPKRPKNELRYQLGLNDKFTVVMVASMGKSKDHTTLIKAAVKVLEKNRDIQIFLVGDGPKKQKYLILVSSFGLENNIFFTGEVRNTEEYLRASDLSVLMSTNAEGFPNVVLESMACGTPVIANDSGGTRELLTNGKNGYLIKSGDYEMLARKIRFLYKNKEVLQKLGKNAALRVREKFEMNKIILDFEGIIGNGIN